jgi:hypothetical protein
MNVQRTVPSPMPGRGAATHRAATWTGPAVSFQRRRVLSTPSRRQQVVDLHRNEITTGALQQGAEEQWTK